MWHSIVKLSHALNYRRGSSLDNPPVSRLSPRAILGVAHVDPRHVPLVEHRVPLLLRLPRQPGNLVRRSPLNNNQRSAYLYSFGVQRCVVMSTGVRVCDRHGHYGCR